jgi:hypothetical protein
LAGTSLQYSGRRVQGGRGRDGAWPCNPSMNVLLTGGGGFLGPLENHPACIPGLSRRHLSRLLVLSTSASQTEGAIQIFYMCAVLYAPVFSMTGRLWLISSSQAGHMWTCSPVITTVVEGNSHRHGSNSCKRWVTLSHISPSWTRFGFRRSS